MVRGSIALSAAAIRPAASSSSCSSSGVKPKPQRVHRPAVERVAAPREEAHAVLHSERGPPSVEVQRRIPSAPRSAIPPGAGAYVDCRAEVPPAATRPTHPSGSGTSAASAARAAPDRLFEQLGHRAFVRPVPLEVRRTRSSVRSARPPPGRDEVADAQAGREHLRERAHVDHHARASRWRAATPDGRRSGTRDRSRPR